MELLSAAEGDGGITAPANLSEALARARGVPDFSIDDIDNGFASIQDRDSKSQSPDNLAGSYADMQSLFADMVAAHLAPIRELLSELEAGQSQSEWLGMCRPVARALQNAAEQLPDQDLHRALSELSAALAAASPNGTLQIAEAERQKLREAYATLSRLLPAVAAVDRERALREPLIIQAIFECTPGLGRVQRDKLIAAGFTGLSMLCLARAEELSSASGVPLELAERLVAEVARFKRVAAKSAIDASRAGERETLGQLTLRLCQQNEAFEASRRGWSRQDQENKRRVQREREETLAQVNVVLAQLGEFALVSELQKLPFERKLSALERFLDPAQSDEPRLYQASGGK
jgi:hypothetical protein